MKVYCDVAFFFFFKLFVSPPVSPDLSEERGSSVSWGCCPTVELYVQALRGGTYLSRMWVLSEWIELLGCSALLVSLAGL